MILNKKLLATTLTLTMAIQSSVGFALAHEQTAKATGYAALVQASGEGKAEIIRNALSDAQMAVGMGVSTETAVKNMATSLVKEGASMSDIDAYVQENSTFDEYVAFRTTMESSFKGVDASNLNEKELGMAITAAIASTKTEGLAWNGCAALGSGIALAVVAVVIGIVALVKSKGVERIKANFQDKRNARTNTFNSDYAYYENIETHLQSDIATYQNYRNQAAMDAAKYLGQATAYANSGNSAAAADALKKADAANKDVAYYDGKIAETQTTLNSYINNPNLKAQKLAQLTADYNADIAAYNAEEKAKIDLVPANQRLAKILGGVAGGLAIPAGLLIGFGARDC